MDAVFMLAAFKHSLHHRHSLLWLISLRRAVLPAILQQRGKFCKGHAQAVADLGEDAHGGIGFPLLDLPDGFVGDLAFFLQTIPAYFSRRPVFSPTGPASGRGCVRRTREPRAD